MLYAAAARLAMGRWLRMMASRSRGDGVPCRREGRGWAAATVTFTAVSFSRPRRLEVRADDAPLGTVEVRTAPVEHHLALPAGQGTTHPTLRSLDGTASPLAVAGTPDDRRLSVGLARVRLATVP